ncbi:hypothetical protein AAE478_007500 [Parahypoxylon ruwenzoriense]
MATLQGRPQPPKKGLQLWNRLVPTWSKNTWIPVLISYITAAVGKAGVAELWDSHPITLTRRFHEGSNAPFLCFRPAFVEEFTMYITIGHVRVKALSACSALPNPPHVDLPVPA